MGILYSGISSICAIAFASPFSTTVCCFAQYDAKLLLFCAIRFRMTNHGLPMDSLYTAANGMYALSLMSSIISADCGSRLYLYFSATSKIAGVIRRQLSAAMASSTAPVISTFWQSIGTETRDRPSCTRVP